MTRDFSALLQDKGGMEVTQVSFDHQLQGVGREHRATLHIANKHHTHTRTLATIKLLRAPSHLAINCNGLPLELPPGAELTIHLTYMPVRRGGGGGGGGREKKKKKNPI